MEFQNWTVEQYANALSSAITVFSISSILDSRKAEICKRIRNRIFENRAFARDQEIFAQLLIAEAFQRRASGIAQTQNEETAPIVAPEYRMARSFAARIFTLFDNAFRSGLYMPSIKISIAGIQLRLQAYGNFQDRIEIFRINPSLMMGTLYRSGDFVKNFDAPEGIAHAAFNATLLFSTQPEVYLQTWARASNRCCLCSRVLETQASRLQGYGPVCAQRYGLPWPGSASTLSSANATQTDAQAIESSSIPTIEEPITAQPLPSRITSSVEALERQRAFIQRQASTALLPTPLPAVRRARDSEERRRGIVATPPEQEYSTNQHHVSVLSQIVSPLTPARSPDDLIYDDEDQQFM